MAIKECDLLVVGGGPGGYTAAIRGAQKGLKTILVERGALGGTCLNRGCIPTKTLLEDALMISAVRNCSFLRGDMKINRKRITERKDLLSEGSRAGITKTLTGNGVKILRGAAGFSAPYTVALKTNDGETEEIKGSKIILATGAAAQYGPDLQPDGKNIWSTDDALSLTSVPRTLAVIGANHLGVEFVAIYHNLGVKIALIEKDKRILPRVHWELADRYKRTLLDRQIKVLTGATAVKADSADNNGVSLTLESDKGQQEIQVDKVLLIGSRLPSYEGLNLEAAGLSLDGEILEHGPSNETQVEGIYVVGDAAGSPYLAHKAIAQAIGAVDHILGINTDKEQPFFPKCIFGDPEIGSVGLTEDEALESGHGVKVGEFYFMGNGRSGTIGNEQGLVKIVSESKTGRVLGVHIMGPQATELISLACLAMQNGIDISGIKRTVFAHPTLAETFFEAALATDGEAIHLLVEPEELEPDV